jgi:hypothetical protein
MARPPAMERILNRAGPLVKPPAAPRGQKFERKMGGRAVPGPARGRARRAALRPVAACADNRRPSANVRGKTQC